MNYPALIGSTIVLVLVQFLAAVPWLWVANEVAFRAWRRQTPQSVIAARAGILLGGLIFAGAFLGMVLALLIRDPERLQFWGGVYGGILQIQLTVDVFILVLVVLLKAWPKGAAVALASFREGLRHPMFWFMLVLALVLMVVMPILPYFTFGEDYKMVKDLGYSTIMLFSAAFGVLAASMLISEEIEGRTAITLMSKPISRRQFLLGKYVGLLLASLAMTFILTFIFDAMLLFKLYYDKEPIPPPSWLPDFSQIWEPRLGQTAADFIAGCGWWFTHVATALPGVVLGAGQVMVLLAIAVALATRLPMIVNVNCCLVVFVLGNLSPILAQVSQNRYPLVKFIAQVFDTLLPGLEHFSLGAAIARDVPPPTGPFTLYIGSVMLYALLYTTIALLLGLILFEDRDLA
jgi:hypothetical protein